MKFQNKIKNQAGLLGYSLAYYSRLLSRVSFVLLMGFSYSLFGQSSSEGLFPARNTTFTFERSITPSSEVIQKGTVAYSGSPNATVKIQGEGTVGGSVGMEYSYEYTVAKVSDGYSLSIESVMNPYHTRFDKEKVKVAYTGDKVFFPAQFTEGSALPDAQGTFMLTMEDGFKVAKKVALKSRKVLKPQSIKINEVSTTAHVVRGTYTLSTLINGETVSSDTETLTQWFVTGKGIVKETRMKPGETITTVTK